MDIREIAIRSMTDEEKKKRIKELLIMANRPYRTPEQKLKLRMEIQQLQTDLTRPLLTRKTSADKVLPINPTTTKETDNEDGKD